MTVLANVSSGIRWNLFGKLTYAGVGFLLTLILARWLGPYEYGIFLILTSIITIFQMVGFLGLETSLLKYIPEYNVKNDSTQIRRFFLSFVLIRLVVAVLVIFLLIFFADFFAKTIFIRAHLQVSHIRLFLFVMFPLALNGLFRNFLDSLYKQKILNSLDVAGIFIRLGFTVVFLSYSRSIGNVIMAYAITEWLILGVLVINVRRMFKFNLDGMPANFKRVLLCSLTIWITNIAGQLLGKNSDIFLLGMFVDPMVIGSYGLSYTLANMVIMFFLFPIGNIGLVAASEIYSKTDMRKLTEFFSVLLKYDAFFIFPILAGGEVLASNLIGSLYGRQYIHGAIFFQIFLCVFATAILFAGPAGTFLLTLGANRILLLGQGFGILNVIINFFLIPLYGAWGALIGTSLIGLISAGFFVIMLGKRMRLKFPIAFFLKAFFSALIMGVSLVLLKKFISSPFKLFVSVCMGLFIYILVLRMCNPLTSRDIYLLDNSNIPGKKFIKYILSGS